jgi:hypothetical protein
MAATGLQGPLMFLYKPPDKWRKAFFAIKGSKVNGYDDPKFTRKFGSWNLHKLRTPYNVTEANAKNEDHLFAFQIIFSTDNVVYLGASSVKVRDQWITAMHTVVRQHLPQNPLLAEAQALLANPTTPSLLTQTVDEKEAEEMINQAADDNKTKLDLSNLNLEDGSLDRFVTGKLSQRLPKLRILDISSSKFTVLPTEISNLRYLTKLSLANCKLTEWPVDIRKLRKLIFLDLSSNQIRLIPEEIGYLSTLEKLNLQKNQITSMHDAIGCLRNLEEIYLSENPRFRTIATSLGECRNLRKILVNNCNLSRIPMELTYLFQLDILQLSNNIITELPNTLGRLTTMSLLDVSNNKLTSIPPSVGQCVKLLINDGLKIDNNPLQDKDLLAAYSKGGDVVLEYLQELIVKFGVPRYEDPPYPEPRKIPPWKDDFVYEVDPREAAKNAAIEKQKADEKLRALQQQQQTMLQAKAPSVKSQPRSQQPDPRASAVAPPKLQAPARTQSGQPRTQHSPSRTRATPQRVEPVISVQKLDEVKLEWASTTLEVLSARLSIAIETLSAINQVEKLQPYVGQLRQIKTETAKAANYVTIEPAQVELVDDKFGRAKNITLAGYKDALSALEAFSKWITQNPSPEQFEEVVDIITAIKDAL